MLPAASPACIPPPVGPAHPVLIVKQRHPRWDKGVKTHCAYTVGSSLTFRSGLIETDLPRAATTKKTRDAASVFPRAKRQRTLRVAKEHRVKRAFREQIAQMYPPKKTT